MHFHLSLKITRSTVSLHAVGLRQATVGVIPGQKAVLQVNHRLTNLLIACQEIIVIHRDFQVLVLRQETRHLKHPKTKQKGCAINDMDMDHTVYITFSIV